jgi:hypothetical protein
MRNRRPRTALLFVGLGVVLLGAIVVGQKLGEQTIFGNTERRVEVPAQTVTPVPGDTPGANESVSRNWKRLQVVSVATDPAFPDPRVTPRPTPSPKPTRSPTPAPTPLPTPADVYTSPPLPLPLTTGGDTPAP